MIWSLFATPPHCRTLSIAACDTAFTSISHHHPRTDPRLAFLLESKTLCAWLVILDDRFVVRHRYQNSRYLRLPSILILAANFFAYLSLDTPLKPVLLVQITIFLFYIFGISFFGCFAWMAARLYAMTASFVVPAKHTIYQCSVVCHQLCSVPWICSLACCTHLVHTSESDRVCWIKVFSSVFVILRNFVLKVQFGCWTSCLDGSTIVRSRSLLGCVKRANKVLYYFINSDLCLVPPILFLLYFILRSVLSLLSFSFWHCSLSFFPRGWCGQSLVTMFFPCLSCWITLKWKRQCRLKGVDDSLHWFRLRLEVGGMKNSNNIFNSVVSQSTEKFSFFRFFVFFNEDELGWKKRNLLL